MSTDNQAEDEKLKREYARRMGKDGYSLDRPSLTCPTRGAIFGEVVSVKDQWGRVWHKIVPHGHG